jgi:uncharacterized protein
MILVDSSVFIALADKSDQWHTAAKGLLPRMKSETIVVSDLIIAEVLTVIGKRCGGKPVEELYHFFLDSCDIIPLDEEARDGAVRVSVRFDGKLSLSDSLSIWMMEKNGISCIFSFDSDFDRVGPITRVR